MFNATLLIYNCLFFVCELDKDGEETLAEMEVVSCHDFLVFEVIEEADLRYLFSGLVVQQVCML